MPRRRRPYLPNAIFHLTARTQGRVHWFDAAMRDFILEAIGIVQEKTDAKLRAYVIMSNHIHVLLQQGALPLAGFMQPLLCRIALAIKRKHQPDGHVFGRTYWDDPCYDVQHAAAVVNYIHANPLRAELCDSPADWPWSSYRAYTEPDATQFPIVEPLFDVVPTMPAAVIVSPTTPPPFSPRLDLRDLLEFTLRELTNGEITLHELRMTRGGQATRWRRALIKRAGQIGYRGCAIANALGVSESTVSKVVRSAKLARARL